MPSTINTGSRDADVVVTATSLSPFCITAPTVLNRVAGNVGVTQATKLVEIGIYNANLTRITSTEKREVPEAGGFEFSHPEVTLQPGNYYYAVSCNGTTASFGHSYRNGGLKATLSLPLGTLSGVVPTVSFPSLTGYAKSNFSITNFAGITNNNVRVFWLDNTSKIWGLNLANFNICWSSNNGDSYTDAMEVPNMGTAGLFDLIVYNNKIYILASDLKVYQSSNLTPTATWTDISCPTTVGLRRTTATGRPYGIAIFNDYLVMGEYSGNVDLQNDPFDPAPPRILKYGPLASAPVWTVTKQMAGARHIHSLFALNSTRLWASVGDAGYGTDIGIWACTNIVTNIWAKWNNVSAPNNDYYPVDFIEINPGIGCATGIFAASDKPGKHVLYSKVTGTAGSYNLSAQVFQQNALPVETVRSLVLDPTNRNIYYFTQESSDPALYVTPAPYTETYRLDSIAGMGVVSRSIISGGYLLMFDRRWKIAKFPWQN